MTITNETKMLATMIKVSKLMTRQDLIDLMESDAAIGVKDFMAMHDQYITSMITQKLGYAQDELEYIASYVKFLEDHYMEVL